MKYLEKTRLGLLYGASRVFPPEGWGNGGWGGGGSSAGGFAGAA